MSWNKRVGILSNCFYRERTKQGLERLGIVDKELAQLKEENNILNKENLILKMELIEDGAYLSIFFVSFHFFRNFQFYLQAVATFPSQCLFHRAKHKSVGF